MRKKDKEITDRSEIDSILRSQIVCRLAMCDGDVPYVVPLSYGYDGKSIYIHCAKEGRKLDVLRRNNNVCFEVDCDQHLVDADKVCKKSMRYRSVIGWGKAHMVEDNADKLRALDVLLEQHYGKGTYQFDQEKVDITAIIRVDIEIVTGKKSGY